MSSSSEEELGDLTRCQVICQPRSFEERRFFFYIEDPREFRRKFGLPVETFIHLLEF